MYASMVYWKGGKIDKRKVEVSPAVFKMVGYAYWKILSADEDVEVKKNEVSIVKIKEILLPSNTIVSPLSIMRHGLGVVLDAYEEKPSRVEEAKKLVAVAFLPIEDGEIKKGDLLGVVKVFIVGVMPIEMISKVKLPEDIGIEHSEKLLKFSIKSENVNMVYRMNGEVVREQKEVSEYWYSRWHVAEWYPLIADEDLLVQPGKLELVKIKNLEIPPETIPVPLSIMRHAYGTVLDVYHSGKPKKIEESKSISKAIFMPVFSGEIKKGDIIGVLNIYYISVGERIRSLMRFLTQRVRGNLVYWRDKTVERKEIEMEPFSFKRSAIGRFEPLIAAENKKVRSNQVEVIEIEELEFPSGTILQPMTTKNHAIGVVLDVMSFEPLKRVEDDKRITSAIFLPLMDGEIKKGELLGVLNVYHVSVFREPDFFLARYRQLFPEKRVVSTL